MSSTHRNYCCCCIPYRIAVLIVSLLSLAFGGVTLWGLLRSGITDLTTRYATYVLSGIYLLLGVSGLFAVAIKRYAVAKNFSVLWWIATVLITILSVLGIVLLATREQLEVRGICQIALLEARGGTSYTPEALQEDVASCYRNSMIIVGVVTSVQLFLMLGYAFLQPQPQPQPAMSVQPNYQKTHPYQHLG
ncbi:hypothetical protein BGX29_009394 [Mortierella sp. GBA35]|nr:hypothetical protein BGX29_009394 [Mortierella sp. GBA35]